MRQTKKTPEKTKRILNKSKSDPLPNPVHKNNMHKIRSINDKVKISKPQKEKLTGKTQNFRKNEKHQNKKLQIQRKSTPYSPCTINKQINDSPKQKIKLTLSETYIFYLSKKQHFQLKPFPKVTSSYL